MVEPLVVPDYVGSLIAFLRSQPSVTMLCPPERISGRLPDAEGMPRFAVTFQKVGGGGNDRYYPIMRPRVDIRCYGTTPYEAMRLWRHVHSVLIPADRMHIGFIAAGCRVEDINCEILPIGDIEPDTGWPRVLASYRLQIDEVPV